MKYRAPKLLIALVGVFILSACSSSGTMQFSKGKSETIPPGKSVMLSVAPALSADNKKNSAEEVTEITQRLKSALFGRLVSEGVFRQVYHVGESADYRMDVEITEASEVSQGARIFLGVLAGSNKLTASVSVYNQSTGMNISSFKVKGKSASHPFSTESGLDDAVREAATKIIMALR